MDAIMFPHTGQKKAENHWQFGVSGDKPLPLSTSALRLQLGFEGGEQEEIKMRRRPHMIFNVTKNHWKGLIFLFLQDEF